MENPHANDESMGSEGNRLRGSSWAQRLIEQEHRRECRSQDGHETRVDLHVVSFKGEQIVSYKPKASYHNDQDREM